MMNRAAIAARWLAITIAVLGVVDPALMVLRPVKPELSIIATTRGDAATARALADRLDDDFTIINGPWDNAAAAVLVGHSLPERLPGNHRYFVVRDSARPMIARFDVPATATSEATLPVRVSWRGNTAVALRANGVVVDRHEASASTDAAAFAYIPTGPGPVHLQAHAVRGADSITVDAVTHIGDRPHAVLFFDRRPSWMSTFVRRTLEQDRRFAVASRVITSRGVSTDAGQPPSTLADPSVLELYDVIVVGAPDVLSAADVAGLETFLRRRGGAVVLLFDENAKPGAHQRLTGPSRWTATALRTAADVIQQPGLVVLRVTEAAWPATIPPGGEVRASIRIGDQMRPVLWTAPIGGGQVIVSGALDAWKLRDPATSSFDDFWRATISRAAREAQEAVTVEVTPAIAEPGERLRVRVTVRDTLASPTALLDSAVVPLWRGGRAGEFEGEVRAPAVGDHWLRAAAGARAERPLLVRGRVSRLGRDDSRALGLLARATGGAVGTPDGVAIRRAVVGASRLDRWWPMRSGWWILPFAALLGFDWFARRRRGLA